jgi:hypothetical protein
MGDGVSPKCKHGRTCILDGCCLLVGHVRDPEVTRLARTVVKAEELGRDLGRDLVPSVAFLHSRDPAELVARAPALVLTNTNAHKQPDNTLIKKRLLQEKGTLGTHIPTEHSPASTATVEYAALLEQRTFIPTITFDTHSFSHYR